MSTETIPGLSPSRSTPLRIPARPQWRTTAHQLVHRFLTSAAVASLAALALTLIGAGR